MQLKFTFALLTSFIATGLASTVANVEADIATISSQVTALDNAINAFPATGGTLLQALTIHNDAAALSPSIQKGTTDVQGVPPPISETDGQTILKSVQGFEPTILDALKQIVAKKAALAALPVGGIVALVKQDLGFLSGNTTAFENALIASAPTDLKSQATAIKTAIDAAFATAIAAYA
ncbi:hydrophobic surface binding protein A-domain-containing protein [Crucibulum laeve]|uniref:Hydrophobic surface binding protein A-domain-containing protein n=1 Tax=Crucibulum laeve TaxID=68775 RepID=A0A5C3LKV8_9AGAR|nr:hydrophobic surface binding protein A-domain-containing protein [Crucibulum laeve]